MFENIGSTPQPERDNQQGTQEGLPTDPNELAYAYEELIIDPQTQQMIDDWRNKWGRKRNVGRWMGDYPFIGYPETKLRGNKVMDIMLDQMRRQFCCAHDEDTETKKSFLTNLGNNLSKYYSTGEVKFDAWFYSFPHFSASYVNNTVDSIVKEDAKIPIMQILDRLLLNKADALFDPLIEVSDSIFTSLWYFGVFEERYGKPKEEFTALDGVLEELITDQRNITEYSFSFSIPILSARLIRRRANSCEAKLEELLGNAPANVRDSMLRQYSKLREKYKF